MNAVPGRSRPIAPLDSWCAQGAGGAQRHQSAWRQTLERLAAKYRTLVSLHASREAVRANGGDRFEGDEAAVRRRIFRRLAREFPGALRELDSSSAETLGLRWRQVEEALRTLDRDGFDGQPPWIAVVADYHQSLRAALRVRRWLAFRLERGADAIPPAILEEFAERLVRLGRMRGVTGRETHRHGASAGAGPGDCSLLDHQLERLFGLNLRGLEQRLQGLICPQDGRLQSVVWAELEAIHGLGRAELERLIFAP